MRPGDVYVLNAPYNGGTHLPDVTVITPVFAEDDGDGTGDVLFYVASRGHQADIGGITPGSMPPDSRSVEEEGVLIDNFLLVDAGRFREQEMVALLSSGRYPSRNPAQNIADLKAQIAACEKGVQELHRMVRHFGQAAVEAYMGHVQDNAEEAVRRVLSVLNDGEFAYETDDGAVIKVRIAIDRAGRRAVIDFTGTSPQLPTNFNAPSAVCKAAVLYVFRTLVDDEIPMNGGCLKPLELIIPPGSMLNPRYPAAVVAGNVETSQCVTDALYGALGVMAAAQGTMNNFTFGNERYQYYETICGGSGAGPGFRRHRRRPHAYDQLAADRSRGAGMALPGAARELRHPPRLRRRRATSRRRRRGPPHPLPRGDDRGDPLRASPRAALRPAGWRARRARAQLGRARRWQPRELRRHPRDRSERRRRLRHRDPGRRRLRQGRCRTRGCGVALSALRARWSRVRRR